MSWEEVIKNVEDRAANSAQIQSFHEDLAQMTQGLIDDLQQAISSGKVTGGRLRAVFKNHGIKFDVLNFNYADVNYMRDGPR